MKYYGPIELTALQRQGRILRQIRERRGLTQGQLGRLSKYDQGNISYVESGKKGISLVGACRVATALGMTLDEAFGEFQADLELLDLPGVLTKTSHQG